MGGKKPAHSEGRRPGREVATLEAVLRALRKYYGKPRAPISSDPFKLVLWEQVAYLVPDVRRREAYTALAKSIGLAPARILAAPGPKLLAVTRLGGSIAAPQRVGRLRRSAEIVADRWQGNLRRALKLPLPQARRALAAFPMIGEPGADKILLFSKSARLLPLDSNGLRVLQRLGLAPEARDYRTAYRRAQESIAAFLPRTHQALIQAYSLLREHGQVLCRRAAPRCPECPLRPVCPFGRNSGQ